MRKLIRFVDTQNHIGIGTVPISLLEKGHKLSCKLFYLRLENGNCFFISCPSSNRVCLGFCPFVHRSFLVGFLCRGRSWHQVCLLFCVCLLSQPGSCRLLFVLKSLLVNTRLLHQLSGSWGVVAGQCRVSLLLLSPGPHLFHCILRCLSFFFSVCWLFGLDFIFLSVSLPHCLPEFVFCSTGALSSEAVGDDPLLSRVSRFLLFASMMALWAKTA